MLIRQIVASAFIALALGLLAIAPASIALPILGWLAAQIVVGIIVGTAMDLMGRGPRIADLDRVSFTHNGYITHD